MNRGPIQIIILIAALLASMWGMSELISARDQTRNVFLGVGFFVILLLALWRKIPLDVKLLFIVIMGYAIGGKGFAYVSPFEPIFIGEICLALCICGFVLRIGRCGLAETTIHKLVWVYLIYAGIHLLTDFPTYNLMAIRDSSMAYYSLFFCATYLMFQNPSIMAAFEKILFIAVLLSVFQTVSYSLMLKIGVGIKIPGFFPHVDAFTPLNAGCALLFLVKGVEQKKAHYLALGAFTALTMFNGKTSAMLALFAVIGTSIFFGRVRGLLMPAMAIGAVGGLALAVVTMVNPEFLTDSVGGGDTAEAFGLEGGEFVGFSGTSSWRWDWWMLIWRDTMEMAPFWGQGFGADITSPFLMDWLGIEPTSDVAQSYARYPHNIMFTVIGRLGLIGLFIFGLLFISIGLLALRFCRRYFPSGDRRDADLMVYGIVVAGMVNGVLQATYEVPHAAITHWICLGYMAVRYYRPDNRELQSGNLSQNNL